MNSLPSLAELRTRVHAHTAREIAPPPPIAPAATWYAVQSSPQREVKAMHGLAALGWPTFIPMGWKWARPRHAPSGTHVMRRRPAMPGYVFFAPDADERGDCRIGAARDVDGVKDFVKQQGAPLPILSATIEKLRTAEARGLFDFNPEPPRGKKLWELEPGDHIKITEGVGTGWIAIVRRRCSSGQAEAVDLVFGIKLTVLLEHCVPVEI